MICQIAGSHGEAHSQSETVPASGESSSMITGIYSYSSTIYSSNW